MSWVLQCDYPDMSTDPPVACKGVEYWAELQDPSSGFLPTLSLEDAAQIGMAIAFLWAVAFAWREIRRAVSSTDRGE